MNGDDAERRAIRDAMDRLFASTPLYSDGKLTVKSLSVEARVKRWVLTHKHKDLKDEFYARIATQGSMPEAIRVLHEQISVLEQERKQERADLREAVATTRHFARVVQVLTLENAQLEARLNGEAPRVTPIRGGTGADGA